MIVLPGYKIKEKIHDGKKTLVYRGNINSILKPVIIKVLKKEYPSDKELATFQREYEILKMLNFDGVVQVLELLPYQHSLAIIFKDFGGVAFNQCSPKKLSLDVFFPVALSLIKTLEKIHLSNIIHKDIKPANIIIHPKTQEIKIIDFGISSLLSRENPKILHPKLLEGTLAYMSPEQTGWMNCELDYRTDFYSLGITFYEMLCGQTPFRTKDPMELIHCHIAKTIPPLKEHRENIPSIISNIILKMLSKASENRYSSCNGLHHDLEKCYDEWKQKKEIQNFSLAQKEISHKFQMSEKICGREQETNQLLCSFDRVSQGSNELTSVVGDPGVGKSKLIREIHKEILEKKGFFAQGKFNQFNKHPYSVIIQSFQELVQYILAENKENISYWKREILLACDDSAQVLINEIPDIELIIGKQPVLQELSRHESENRFQQIFINFIQIFAEKRRPIVLFFDDLQWADLGSLKFIQFLLTNIKTQYILLIIAYRGNEVTEIHPLKIMFEYLEKMNIKHQQIQLLSLGQTQVNTWIQNSLSSSEDTRKLTSLIVQKTRGNPFFVKEFMTALYNKELLAFQNNSWVFYLEEIKVTNITTNVVALLCSRIKNLQPSYREVLQLASCIGNKFNTKILHSITRKNREEICLIFNELIEQGFIFSQGNYNPFLDDNFNFQFSHDQVHQATYSTIEEAIIIDTHLKIGRLFIKNFTKQQENKLFDIVEHMNKAKRFIIDKERFLLTKLNFRAGQKAMYSAEYNSADNFFNTARSLLEKNSWETNYDLTFSIYSKEAECKYINGDFDESEYLFNFLLKNANNNIKIAKIYTTKITLLINQGKHLEAIELGQKGLKLFGVNLPTLPGNNKTTIIEFIKVQIFLYGRNPESLLLLPKMKEKEKLVVMNLLMSIAPSTFFISLEFFACTIFKMLLLTLRYGNSIASPFAYVCYGIIMGSGFKHYKTGYKFGQLALTLGEKNKETSIYAKTLNLFGSLVCHWHEAAKNDSEYLLKAYTESLKCGDPMFACFSLTYAIQKMIISGKNLDHIFSKITNYENFSTQIKYEESSLVFNVYRKMIINLQEPFLKKDSPDSFLEKLKEQKNLIPLHWYYISRLQILYLFGFYEEAIVIAKKSEKMMKISKGSFPIADHYFYYTLLLSSMYKTASCHDKKKYRCIIKHNQKKIKLWSTFCKENFYHKYLLCEAERLRAFNKKNPIKIIEIYDQAIQFAQENEYIQDEALANELAGQFCLSMNKKTFAKVYLKEAQYNYKKWGAKNKVRELSEKYPFIFACDPSTKQDSSMITFSTTIAHSSILNITTVLKASQLISQEILLDKLLRQLIKISLENAGAEKGFLIIPRNGQFFIEAKGIVNKEVTICNSVLLEKCNDLPSNIVNYVGRTCKQVILKDASNEGKFTQDRYIKKHDPKSIMCMPVIKLEKLIAIFYLENNQITNAFTGKQLEALEIITSQAAISIENAQLYADIKKNQKKLKNSEKKYRLLMEQASDGIFIFDLQGNHKNANSKACEMLGYTKKELFNINMEEVLCVSSIEIKKLLAGKTLIRECALHCKNKNTNTIPVEMSIKTINDGRIQAIVRDITERKRLQREVLKISEREKQQVAQDLHDSLGQELAGAKFLSESLSKSLTKKSLREAIDAKKVVTILGDAIENTRRLAHGLHPIVLEMEGILIALKQLTENIKSLYKIECIFEYNKIMNIKDSSVEIELYRITQEAVNNAIKHGKANRILVSLTCVEEQIILLIEDNGCGLPKKPLEKLGLGLRSMQYRAQILGASLKIENNNNPQGVRIICILKE